MWITAKSVYRGLTVYAIKTPDNYEFYVPGGIKILSVRPEGIKLQYSHGDIEIVSIKTVFKIRP